MKKFANSLQYSWWKYVVVVFVVVLVWNYAFSLMVKPKANEQILLTVVGDNLNINDLSTDLFTKKQDITAQPLKDVSVDFFAKDTPNLNVMVDAYGRNGDLVIIDQTTLQNGVGILGFARRIDLEKLQALVGDKLDVSQLEVFEYTLENQTWEYGVYLNNPNDGKTNRFETYYTGAERYVLFFCFESVNLGALYEKGNAQDVGAIDVALYLLEEVN